MDVKLNLKISVFSVYIMFDVIFDNLIIKIMVDRSFSQG